MDAVRELDSLIEMMRDLLEMPGNPGYKTPVYRCTLPSYVSFPFHNFISSLIDCVDIPNYPMPVQRSRRFCTTNGTMQMKKW